MRTSKSVGSWLGLTNPPEVIPINDLRMHNEGFGCWCNPTCDDDVIVHNSLDGREHYERSGQLN